MTQSGHRAPLFVAMHATDTPRAAILGCDPWPRVSPMRRRKFITLLGGAAATWPLSASAQQTAKLPTIGFLGGPTASAAGQWVTFFVQRMRELGWIEGRTVTFEIRWADGRFERFAEI